MHIVRVATKNMEFATAINNETLEKTIDIFIKRFKRQFRELLTNSVEFSYFLFDSIILALSDETVMKISIEEFCNGFGITPIRTLNIEPYTNKIVEMFSTTPKVS